MLASLMDRDAGVLPMAAAMLMMSGLCWLRWSGANRQ